MPRNLRCKNFDEIRADLTLLEKGPVETTGKWSYFQMIDHLTKGIEGSLKGTKREMPFLKRHVFGPLLYQFFALRGYIPARIKGRPSDRIEGNEPEAVARFRKALEAFEKSEAPYSDHPILGPLDKKQWHVFHSMHYANHVRHTLPKN
ncbi:MAG TPA: DUF1569 domain-containing protein [bacterium]|jgi:hypothetical protein|nr:DUF1569 domain-containing protein [bacterium]